MEKFGRVKVTQINLNDLLSNHNRIQVSAYDPGGANVLAPLIKNLDIEADFLIKGQAANIFQAYFNDFEEKNYNYLKAETDLLISSTGWQTSHEFDMMREALNSGVEVIAVLDHWVNYSERFKRGAEEIQPTYFLLFDDYAESIVRSIFEAPKIIKSENHYLATSLRKINVIKQTFSNQVDQDFLFIGEPLSRNNLDITWDEFKALSLFFNTLRSANLTESVIVIKPHPTESRSKYVDSIPNDFPNVTISFGVNLEELISRTKYVVGCHSMALLLAEMAGNKVLTCLPLEEKPRIPLSNVEPIQTFLMQRVSHDE